MGSQRVVSQQQTCATKNIFSVEYIYRKLTIIIMKVAIYFTCVFAMAYAESWMAAPYTLVKRAAQPEPQNTRFNFGSRPSFSSSSSNANTKFFTGNGALDAGLAGAAAGFAGQYLANQVFNPCRTRGGNRNKNTNNRIFGSNTGNFLLGAAGGFAAASVAHAAAGSPCGR